MKRHFYQFDAVAESPGAVDENDVGARKGGQALVEVVTIDFTDLVFFSHCTLNLELMLV